MAAQITAAPCRVSREATQPMRSMFVSRSSLENPRPFERCVRTTSPSRYSTRWPRRSSSGPTISAIVVLPAPDRPVNQSVKPLDIFLLALFGRRVLHERRIGVDAALELVGAGPAACAFLLARSGRPRAGNAADRAVARVVQRVVGNLVDGDVGLDALRVPVDDRVDLPDLVALRPLHLRRRRATG